MPGSYEDDNENEDMGISVNSFSSIMCASNTLTDLPCTNA